MSTGAIIMMICVLSIVWGGFAVSVTLAMRQQKKFDEENKS